MNEQSFQDSNDLQTPDSNALDPDKSEPYKPDSRADVDPRPLVSRPRKHGDGKKLRKQNAQGILQYNVSVVRARYDHVRHSWMYTLNDWQNEPIAGETEETKLG
ncbi:MAG: hypothetical protein Q9175_004387 [Cornicularia normoerica]